MTQLASTPPAQPSSPLAPEDLEGDLIQPDHPLFGTIWVNPDRMSGAPCFAGTRVPIQNLFDYLAGGQPLGEFIEDFPGVTREQVEAVVPLRPKGCFNSSRAHEGPSGSLRPQTPHKARRARRLGLCPACGYDLRASPRRCSECWVVALPKSGKQVRWAPPTLWTVVGGAHPTRCPGCPSAHTRGAEHASVANVVAEAVLRKLRRVGESAFMTSVFPRDASLHDYIRNS